MKTLKQLFPFSFKKKDGVVGLLINVLIQLIIGAIAGFAISLVAAIPVIGLIAGIALGLVDLYVLIGIVLSLLDYCKII